jgi:uncharacterized coiled-coil protein SlyX
MMNDTEERLSKLEEKLAEYDRLIAGLKAYARLTPAGRVLLKALGAS